MPQYPPFSAFSGWAPIIVLTESRRAGYTQSRRVLMKRVSLVIAIGSALLACAALAQAPAAGPNKILKTAKTGGEGGFDYIYADVDGRKLYIPRSGQPSPR